MMTADDVPNEMVVAAARVWNERTAKACNVDAGDQWRWYSEGFKNDARAAIAAAINASGCVLVPRNVLDDLLHEGHLFEGRCPDSAQPDARDPECPMCRAMLAAADPRQKALDRMAENAQELGLYDEGKEKGDE